MTCIRKPSSAVAPPITTRVPLAPADDPCFQTSHGLWQTPLQPVRPLAYYRLRFQAQAVAGGCYAVCFYDARGKVLTSDEYSTFEASATWTRRSVFTQAREDASAMRVFFIANTGEIRIEALEIVEAGAEEVLAWSDRLYATLPPVRVEAAPGQFRHLAAPIRKLQRGGKLRVLVLGDSIANDMGNSQFHLLIQRLYPGSELILLRSIRAATGCTYYRRHVRRYVTAKAPDLVVIAGISHRHDAEAVRHVVEQTRQQMEAPVAFLVLTGAIKVPGPHVPRPSHGRGISDEERRRRATEAERRFYDELTAMQDELGIATLDMRSVWEQYLAACGRPRAWYQRDRIHANARGKQILGRIVEPCFLPEGAARMTGSHVYQSHLLQGGRMPSVGHPVPPGVSPENDQTYNRPFGEYAARAFEEAL